MATQQTPNPIAVAWSVLRAMRRRKPQPGGTGTVDHERFSPILDELKGSGVPALEALREDMTSYRKQLEQVDPDTLSPDEALAYWLNLYNLGALELAADAADQAEETVLRVPGGFSRPWATVAGEELSLEEIEHAKIRRFGDPRIHGALVCGSASCPTLRYEPYRGRDVQDQLDDQMASFFRHGGLQATRTDGVVFLSRLLLWHGSDFARPGRMPTWIPTTKKKVLRSIERWLDPDVLDWLSSERPKVRFQPYDWSLACTIR